MDTVICFLCRVTFQERQGLKDHLIYEHGVVFNLDFVSRVSQFRTEHARLPVIDLNKKNNNRECYKCQDAAPPRVSKNAADFPQIAISNQSQDSETSQSDAGSEQKAGRDCSHAQRGG